MKKNRRPLYFSRPKRFTIHKMDPLGQGVDRTDGDKIHFVYKVLPGEEGIATNYRSKKGLCFSKLESPAKLEKSSPLRINSECAHFNQCFGCHYLHTSYEDEMSFKRDGVYELYQKFYAKRLNIEAIDLDKINIHKNNTRFRYRNRIQLHYDLKKGLLGLIDNTSSNIIEIPECLLPQKEIAASFKDLYLNWKSEIPSSAPAKGHVEIYFKDEKVSIAWNKPYAHGGFEQVNQVMNQLLQNRVKEQIEQLDKTEILDLFGGNGNLTSGIQGVPIQVIDVYPPTKELNINQSFEQVDLFDADKLEEIESDKPPLLILDPPRSGFGHIKAFCDKHRPKNIIYVSCNPATMFRDLAQVPEYQIKSLELFDLFPGTFHIEAMALLELR